MTDSIQRDGDADADGTDRMVKRHRYLARMMAHGIITGPQMGAADRFALARSAFGPDDTITSELDGHASYETRDSVAVMHRRGIEALGADLELFDRTIMQDVRPELDEVERLRAALDRLIRASFVGPGDPGPAPTLN